MGLRVQSLGFRGIRLVVLGGMGSNPTLSARVADICARVAGEICSSFLLRRLQKTTLTLVAWCLGSRPQNHSAVQAKPFPRLRSPN